MNKSHFYRIHHTSKVVLIEDVIQIKLYQQDKLVDIIEKESKHLTNNTASPHVLVSDLEQSQRIQVSTPTQIWSITKDTLDMYLIKERTTQGYPLYVQHGHFSVQILAIKLGTDNYLYARIKMTAPSVWERMLTRIKRTKPYQQGQWMLLKQKGLIVPA